MAKNLLLSLLRVATNSITIFGRAITIKRAMKQTSKELIKYKAKKIKSNNLTMSNREDLNISIVILEIIR